MWWKRKKKKGKERITGENHKRMETESTWERENERNEKLNRQEMLSIMWGMLQWVTNYINENQEDWELAKILQEEEARLELEEFKKKCKAWRILDIYKEM